MIEYTEQRQKLAFFYGKRGKKMLFCAAAEYDLVDSDARQPMATLGYSFFSSAVGFGGEQRG